MLPVGQQRAFGFEIELIKKEEGFWKKTSRLWRKIRRLKRIRITSTQAEGPCGQAGQAPGIFQQPQHFSLVCFPRPGLTPLFCQTCGFPASIKIPQPTPQGQLTKRLLFKAGFYCSWKKRFRGKNLEKTGKTFTLLLNPIDQTEMSVKTTSAFSTQCRNKMLLDY